MNKTNNIDELTDILRKVESAMGTLYEGKVIPAYNKLLGIKQKIEDVLRENIKNLSDEDKAKLILKDISSRDQT